MPGIRVQKPVGDGWEYSLDTTTYQTSPLFTEQSPGVPLVVGTTYIVSCRNLEQNLFTLSSIRLGDPTNAQGGLTPNLTQVAAVDPSTPVTLPAIRPASVSIPPQVPIYEADSVMVLKQIDGLLTAVPMDFYRLSEYMIELMPEAWKGILVERLYSRIKQRLIDEGCLTCVPNAGPTLTGIRIATGPASINEGASGQFTGAADYSDGTSTAIAGGIWAVTGTDVSNDQTGLVTAAANQTPGDTRVVTLRLFWQGKEASRSITINDTTVVVLPPAPYSVGDLFSRKAKAGNLPPELSGGGYYGTLEYANCDDCGGWVAKKGALTTPISVDIYIAVGGTGNLTPVYAGTATPNVQRPDVALALKTSYNPYGWKFVIPAQYRTGVHIWVYAYIVGTQTALNGSPFSTVECLSSAPTVTSRYIQKSASSTGEGGAAVLCTVMERLSSGPDRAYANASAVAWSTVGAGPGIGFNGNSFAAGENTVNGNTFVEIHAAFPEGLLTDQIEVLEAGCHRPAGLATFYLAWNFTAQFGGAFHAFQNLADANNTVGAAFDQSVPGQLTTFAVQCSSISLNADVYLVNGTDDCSRATGVALAVLDSVGSNTIKKAIRLEGGKIVEIGASTYVSPVLLDVALNKTVTAPANSLDANWAARNITIDNSGGLYSTDCVGVTTPVTILVDLYGLARPWFVKITPRPDDGGAMPLDYVVQGSYSGSSWDTLASVTNQARGTAEITLQLPRNAQGIYGQYRFIRLVTSRNGAATADCARVQVGRFRVMAPELLALPYTGPAGTENCVGYAQLTPEQYAAYPILFFYEYYNPAEHVRPFASRDEALALMPNQGQSGAYAHFDRMSCSSATAEIGAVMYNDDRPEHDDINYGDGQNHHYTWPVEAGWWGFDFNRKTNGQGSYVLLQTNACGQIINRETITLYPAP